MRIYLLPNTDIYTHLATEHWFLHHSQMEIVLLWQSYNAVVCGKHQNIAAEVNLKYALENKVAIARRLTGGGTVYQDMGNVCFTIIKNHEGPVERTVDYKQFLDPIKDFLNQNNVPATYSARNDLMVEDKKISGNAQHVFIKQQRVLHHGTLLFDSNLATLGTAIKPAPGVSHRGVNSVRSQVSNIKQYTVFDTSLALMQALEKYYVSRGFFAAELDEIQYQFIEKYKQEKYQTPEWIYDYSPKHSLKRSFEWQNTNCTVQASIAKGMVEEIKLEPLLDGFECLQSQLIGSWRMDRIKQVLNTSVLKPIAEEWIYLLF